MHVLKTPAEREAERLKMRQKLINDCNLVFRITGGIPSTLLSGYHNDAKAHAKTLEGKEKKKVLSQAAVIEKLLALRNELEKATNHAPIRTPETGIGGTQEDLPGKNGKGSAGDTKEKTER